MTVPLLLSVLTGDGFSLTRYVYRRAATAESNHLVDLIIHPDSSAQALEKAMYLGIDLNRIVMYCNIGKAKNSPGYKIKYNCCYTPLGVAFHDLQHYTNEWRDVILLDKVKVLIEHGASVYDDPAVVFLAVIENRLDIVSLVLHKGVNVNTLRARVRGHLGKQDAETVIASVTPIERKACADKSYRTTETILDTSAYLYLIHAVAGAGSREMLDLFISFGADCTLKDYYGRTALDWALRRWDRDKYIIEELRERIPQTDKKEGGTGKGVGVTIVVSILLIAAVLVLFRPQNTQSPKRKAVIKGSGGRW